MFARVYHAGSAYCFVYKTVNNGGSDQPDENERIPAGEISDESIWDRMLARNGSILIEINLQSAASKGR